MAANIRSLDDSGDVNAAKLSGFFSRNPGSCTSSDKCQLAEECSSSSLSVTHQLPGYKLPRDCKVCFFSRVNTSTGKGSNILWDTIEFTSSSFRPSLAYYRVSAWQGCEFCRSIVGIADRITSHIGKHVPLGLTENLELKLEESLTFTHYSHHRKVIHMYVNLFVRGAAEHGCPSHWERRRPWFVGDDTGGMHHINYYLRHHPLKFPDVNIVDTGSLPVRKQIHQWLAECQSSHMDCQLAHEAPMPRRVLEIDIEENRIRLVDWEAGTGSHPYACLSHRWNEKTVAARLMESNFHGRKGWSSIESLPRLFRDAALFVAGTGTKYLWIDCLCIIQDSTGGKDWHLKSAAMAGIYENAVFTVFAAWCLGSEQALFSPGDEMYRPVPLMSSDMDRCDDAFLRVWPVHPNFGSQDHEHNTQFPLFKRGWVLQEFALSRRLIIFSRNEAHWICRQEDWCLCGLRGFGGIGRKGLSPADLLTAPWYEVVTLFSGMDLTFSQDRLPALAGVASRYGARTGLTYAAGLWIENLSKDLFWISNGTRARPRKVDIAPTWSWASVDGPIEYHIDTHDKPLHPDVEIGMPKVILVGTSLYGQVRSGRLPLRIPVTLVPMVTAWTFMGLASYLRQIDDFKDVFEDVLKDDFKDAEIPSSLPGDTRKSCISQVDETKSKAGHFLHVGKELAAVYPDYDFDAVDSGRAHTVNEVYVAVWTAADDYATPYSGFVLRLVGEHLGQHCYERIGVAFADGPNCLETSIEPSSVEFWEEVLVRSTVEDIFIV